MSGSFATTSKATRRRPLRASRFNAASSTIPPRPMFTKTASSGSRANRSDETAPAVAPRADEPMVTKQYASAFFGTSLASLLRAQGVDCVLLAGMSTSGCVRASAVDAMQHGFIPVVIGDACGDRHPAPHEANLFDLQAKYADVLNFAQLRAVLPG